MQMTPDQQEETQRLFATRRRRQILLAVPLLPVFIGVLVVRERADSTVLGVPAEVWGPAFLVLAIAALLFSLWNWRCPACEKYLGKGINPHFCPKCGVALQADR
jgi:hypothetical protein